MTSSVEGICRKFRLKSKYVYDFAHHHASRTFVRDTDARHASRTFLCTVPQPLPSRDTHLCTSLPSPATRTTFPFARNLPSRDTHRARPCALLRTTVARDTHRGQLCASRTTLHNLAQPSLPSRATRIAHNFAHCARSCATVARHHHA